VESPCSVGVEDLGIAAAGSPHVGGELVDLVDTNTGFSGQAFSPDTIRPKGADVRGGARTSASSRAAERDPRVRGEPDAIDLPSEVLPTPGGPTNSRIGPYLLGASLPQELEDGA
jgi:hypothetical protein